MRLKDKFARAQNILTNKKLKAIEQGSLEQALIDIQILQDQLQTLQNNFNSLSNAYNSHTHDYEDGNGTEITTKTTGGAN